MTKDEGKQICETNISKHSNNLSLIELTNPCHLKLSISILSIVFCLSSAFRATDLYPFSFPFLSSSRANGND